MKRYIKPTSEIIDIETSLMLAQSIYVGGGDEPFDPDKEEQLSNEHREGDWENIWGNM
jgi:hypothetical protein